MSRLSSISWEINQIIWGGKPGKERAEKKYKEYNYMGNFKCFFLYGHRQGMCMQPECYCELGLANFITSSVHKAEPFFEVKMLNCLNSVIIHKSVCHGSGFGRRQMQTKRNRKQTVRRYMT